MSRVRKRDSRTRAPAGAAPRPLLFHGTSCVGLEKNLPRRPQLILDPLSLTFVRSTCKTLGLSLGRLDGSPLAGLAAFGHRESLNHMGAKSTTPEHRLRRLPSFRTRDVPQGMKMNLGCGVPFPPAWCRGYLGQSWCLPTSRLEGLA